MPDFIIRYLSDAHQRFENGNRVMDYQHCGRLITVERNINGCSGYRLVNGDGYIVRIHNLDLDKPQMSPKPMRLVNASNNKIELRGYPVQAITPFGWDNFDLSDYGLTLLLEENTIKQCTLHMFDRNTEIEYYIESCNFPTFDFTAFYEENPAKELTNVEKYAKQSLKLLKEGNQSAAYSACLDCYAAFKYSPATLQSVCDFESVGISLLTLLTFERIDDIDVQQRIASISYLFLSKALKEKTMDINLYRCRFLLLNMYQEALQYTVMTALNIGLGYHICNIGMFRARDEIFAMKYADIQDCPKLSRIDNMFMQAERDLKQKITSGFFGSNENTITFAERGRMNHARLLHYLEEKVFEDVDIDF